MGNSPQSVNNISFKTYDQLTENLRQNGVESLQSALFIDFSKSNQWTGNRTYGHNLHDITKQITPYEHVLKTLSPIFDNFDDDGIYPVYRFGCSVTRDQSVVGLEYPENPDEHIHGMEKVCEIYRQQVPKITFAGPTTIGPCIMQGINISKAYKEQNIRQHVVLVIITDGDVSDFERDKRAVIEAANYPISICVIGVGDGPFDSMEKFDRLRGRRFDNLHFCNFTSFIMRHQRDENPELSLATEVFTEVGRQHSVMIQLGIL